MATLTYANGLKILLSATNVPKGNNEANPAQKNVLKFHLNFKVATRTIIQ